VRLHQAPFPRTTTRMTAPRTPPVADRRAHNEAHHGVTIDDPYNWLKDPGYPTVEDADVLAYLRAENAYFEAQMAPHGELVETLFAELKGRVPQEDASVPARDGDFDYWWRFDHGGQYRVWLRRPAAGGDEMVVLSEPALAEGTSYFRLAGSTVSPDGRLLAYAYDATGAERFTLKIRDLVTGADIATVTNQSIGVPVWAADSTAVAWTEVNDAWRPFRINLYRIGGGDMVLYEEPDVGFRVGVARSHDRRQWIVTVADHVTSEIHLIPTDAPTAPPLLVSPRQTGREYDVDVRKETLFIRTNDDHRNFRIATAPLAAAGDWTTLIAGTDRVYIRSVTPFTSYLAIEERVDGLDAVRLRRDDGSETHIAFPEASFSAALGTNLMADAPVLRLGYSSMVTPATVFDYDVATATLTPRKVQAIPSGYDASQYTTERLMIRARDGVAVPVSLVYRKGFPKDGSGRLHLYGYGAYGIAIPPSFSASRLSLLDRGFAYAIAHIRGGDDLGYQWYLDGKLEHRTNTFNDFVDVARGLIAAGFTRAGHITTSGGSAGGELMGAVINSDPDLWGAVVADVPFVDVLNTMLDASLPLTPGEWPEWGNPITDAAAFELIRSYSPYDNVVAQAYPPMLVTAGLNDPRVTYWEPAKWVAKLRSTRTDENLLLLKTNMDAGHGGQSGRFTALRETAEEFAFILAASGLVDASR
jgi:oligopeptidase B